MKEVKVVADINSGIVKAAERPFADEMLALARSISSSLQSSLDSGDIGDIEAAGRQALAVMLSSYANGTLPEKQAFSFLKSLAERKTPDPVQKIEQHNVTDMRVLIQELIQANPSALENTTSIAAEGKAMIQQQLGLPEASFDLEPAPTTDSPDTPDSLPNDPTPLPSTPDEIDNIRAGRSPQEGIAGWRRFSNNNTGGREDG